MSEPEIAQSAAAESLSLIRKALRSEWCATASRPDLELAAAQSLAQLAVLEVQREQTQALERIADRLDELRAELAPVSIEVDPAAFGDSRRI